MRVGRIVIACAVFAVAVAVGFTTARPLAPARLHAEVEQLLSELLDTDVEIGTLRISFGWGIELEGYDVVAWPTERGPALRAAVARAEIRPFSHLTGQRRVRSITLEHPQLEVARAPDGTFSPPPAEELFGAEPESPTDQPEELLQPLIAFETTLRRALEELVVTDRFEIIDGRIDFADARRAQRHELSLVSIHGSLSHSGFFDETELVLAARLSQAAVDRGGFEWDGRRERDGSLRIAAGATALELGVLSPWLLDARPDAELSASVSGAVVFDSPQLGHGRLEVDAIALGVQSAPEPVTRGPLVAERVALNGVAAISPGEVRLEDLQLTSDQFGLVLDGALQRPLVGGSSTNLALAVRDVTVRDLRHLVSWLPAVQRDEAEQLFASVERGRLHMLRTAGRASLDRWQALLAGRTAQLPDHFVVDAQLDDTTVRVGDDDRMEDFSGRLWWTGDRIELRDARALLNGSPLPQLDLTVDGISHLFASDEEARKLRDGAEPLLGLRTLWLATHPEPGGSRELDLRLEVDHLEHPMFFWPISEADARVRTVEHGVNIEIERGRWAGVPVSGDVTWLFEPEESVEAVFSAARAPRTRPERQADENWAVGRFEVGPIRSESWAHQRASGEFRAREARITLEDIEVDLLPTGRAAASGNVDVSEPDRVPIDAAFTLADGDLAQVGGGIGLPHDFASGTLQATGELSSVLRTDASILSGLEGTLGFEARDGWMQRKIPAVVALALASASINPFASRERTRFDRLAADVVFEAGSLRTQSLTLDGPDVRAFASGAIEVGREPFDLDVEVVLYLFRPVDFVLDKIPLVNVLLLGPNDNLVAAHFQLSGPWADPHAVLMPHRSLTQGPGTVVFETVPALVKRGLRAIGSLLTGDDPPPAETAPLPVEPPAAAAPADS